MVAENFGLKTSSAWNSDLGALRSKEDTDDYKKLIRSNGIYTRAELDKFNVFYRFGRLDPYNMLGSTREYVFFTKPDLHIFNSSDIYTLNPELANIPYFYDLMRRGYNTTVLRDLQYSIDKSTPFIKILTNEKRSNLDLNTINVDSVETGANLYGTRIFYRKASDHSDEEGDFTIEFEDSKYLDIYLWFKTFDQYTKKKYEGKVSPPSELYIQNKILHDQMAIYKFIVGEDGETIIHWSQFFGCYPLNVPREVFSDLSSDGHLKFTTNWKCTFQEDMMPNTISDFNALANKTTHSGIEVPIYDASINAMSGENVLVPYISFDSAGLGKYKQYKLKWGV